MDYQTADYRLTNLVVCIIGAGYVGLVAACCLANSGHKVTCVETNEAKLKLLNQGLSPIREKGIDQLLKQGLSSGRLTFSSAPSAPLPQEPYIVFNGRNALAQDKLRALDFNYIGVGRRAK